jgi:hypothetical protein
MDVSSTGRILEIERLLLKELDESKKGHITGIYSQLQKVFRQEETVNLLKEVEGYIAENKGKV